MTHPCRPPPFSLAQSGSESCPVRCFWGKGTDRGLLLLIHVMLRNNILSNGDRNDVVPFRAVRFTSASSAEMPQTCAFRSGHLFPYTRRSHLPFCPDCSGGHPFRTTSFPTLSPRRTFSFFLRLLSLPGSLHHRLPEKRLCKRRSFRPLSFLVRSNRLSPAPPPPSSLIRKRNSSLFLLFSLTYFKTSRIKRKAEQHIRTVLMECQVEGTGGNKISFYFSICHVAY